MRIVRRAIAPTLLAIVGLAAIVWGVLFHRIPVLAEKETETTVEVPLMLPAPGLDGTSSPDEPSLDVPAFVKKTVTRMDEVTLILSEPELMRDISVGGVVRMASGELKRTYSGEEGPAKCPT